MTYKTEVPSIDFGMPTLIETGTVEECAQLCHSLGLQFIELNMNFPQYQTAALRAAELSRLAEQYGIYFTIHLDENLNISDFNPHVSKAYLDTVFETICLAKELGCPILNMHMSRGIYITLPDRRVFLFDEYRERYLQSMLDFRDNCERLIGDANIRICLENSDGFTDFHLAALDILLESPVFGLTFDIGHDYLLGRTDEPVIMDRSGRLFHMHMHDGIGKNIHLALGAGEIDIPKYLKLAADHNTRIVLETKTIEGLTQSAQWIRSF